MSSSSVCIASQVEQAYRQSASAENGGKSINRRTDAVRNRDCRFRIRPVFRGVAIPRPMAITFALDADDASARRPGGQAMQKRVVMNACMAMALSVGLAAQAGGSGSQGSGSQSGSQSSTAQRNQGGNGQTITVTGCVQTGDQATSGGTGTAGTAGTTASGSGSGSGTSGSGTGSSGSTARSGSNAKTQYVLTNVSGWPSGSGGSTTAGAGTSSSGGGSTAASGGAGANSAGGPTITLAGNNLQQHVGHQVEIRGRIDNGAKSGSGSASAGTGASMNETTLRVTSVKMLASTCRDSR
jgi:hypothetical protein